MGKTITDGRQFPFKSLAARKQVTSLREEATHNLVVVHHGGEMKVLLVYIRWKHWNLIWRTTQKTGFLTGLSQIQMGFLSEILTFVEKMRQTDEVRHERRFQRHTKRPWTTPEIFLGRAMMWFAWRALLDSNQWPLASEANTLSTELRARVLGYSAFPV